MSEKEMTAALFPAPKLRPMLRNAALAIAAAIGITACSSDSELSLVEPDTGGGPATMRLVDTQQYINTMSNIFGNSLNLNVNFPPLQRNDGMLANSAATVGVTASQLEQFQRAAASIASQVVAPSRRAFLFHCVPADETLPDSACAREFLGDVGYLLYRRPLTDEQLSAALASADNAAETLGSFYSGIEIALEGLLISPETLFITERTEPDPENPGRERLDAFSLASRLSYLLWNSAPNSELLEAAANGSLHTLEGLNHQLERMLESSRLEDGMRAFFDDMMGFSEFNSIAKDQEIYPFFTGVTLSDAREQTLRTIIDHLITEKKDYRDLYTTRKTFMSPALASLNKLPAQQGWAPYEFPKGSPRLGLLTHTSFLAGHSHPGRTSPTARGTALREILLCQKVPTPPANVDFSAIENPDASYPTQRERVAQHLENPSCAGCHRITDPVGLALENFDGAGRFRLQENGVPIDTTGQLDGTEFTDPIGLAYALRDNPALPACLVERLYTYGMGTTTDAEDRPLLDFYLESFKNNGYRLPDMLRTLVKSKAFSHIEPPFQLEVSQY